MNVKILVAGTLLVAAGLTPGLRAQPLPRTLDLDQAIEFALSRHADLDAARAAIDARAGSTRQAGLSPNPVFSLQTENWRFYGNPGFSASRDLDLFAWVSVPIETAASGPGASSLPRPMNASRSTKANWLPGEFARASRRPIGKPWQP